MPSDLPHFRLRSLFGLSTAVVLACGLLVMMESAPPTSVGWRVTMLSIIMGLVVGYRRAGSAPVRIIIAGLLGLGGCFMAVYLALVATVWQQWNSASDRIDLASCGLGGLVMIMMAPFAAIIAILMLRAWTWSAYDAHLLPPEAPGVVNSLPGTESS